MMRFLGMLILVFNLFWPSVAAAQGRAPLRRYPEAIPGEFLVLLRDDMVARVNVGTVAKAMAHATGGELLATFTHGVRGFGIRVSEVGIERLRDDPRVIRVEENARLHLSGTRTFQDATTYWHLDRIDQSGAIASPYTYSWTSDGTGVDVYVIDTGIRATHDEFYSGQVTSGADYHTGDGYSPTNPCGGNDFINGGHGTGVASLIGGDGVGIAEGVTLIPVKVFACGSAYQPYGIELSLIGGVWATNWVMQQIDARGNRAVVNFSWFYYSDDDCFIAEPLCDPDTDPQQCHYNCATSLESNIYDLLYDYDAVVVASANNQNDDYCVSTGNPTGLTQSPARMGYGGMYDPNPSSYPSRRLVITVGGTDDDDARWVYNSTLGSNVGSCVDIYAPADLIRVAYITSDSAYRTQTNALQSSGTSWSAAIVSGIAARILDAYPTKNPREVWDYIRQSATSLTSNFDGDGNNANDKLVYVSPND